MRSTKEELCWHDYFSERSLLRHNDPVQLCSSMALTGSDAHKNKIWICRRFLTDSQASVKLPRLSEELYCHKQLVESSSAQPVSNGLASPKVNTCSRPWRLQACLCASKFVPYHIVLGAASMHTCLRPKWVCSISKNKKDDQLKHGTITLPYRLYSIPSPA